MSRHISTGVAAVIDEAHSATSRHVWVPDSEVSEALRQIQKLSGERYPDVSTYTLDREEQPEWDRVCLKIE